MTRPSAARQHPVTFAFQTFIKKFCQHPGIYPIKYYKKTRRFKRSKSEAIG